MKSQKQMKKYQTEKKNQRNAYTQTYAQTLFIESILMLK